MLKTGDGSVASYLKIGILARNEDFLYLVSKFFICDAKAAIKYKIFKRFLLRSLTTRYFVSQKTFKVIQLQPATRENPLEAAFSLPPKIEIVPNTASFLFHTNDVAYGVQKGSK